VAANSRLTFAVHALAWLELARQRGYEVLTSQEVAASINTNAVVVRRCLGELRRAGMVDVRRGSRSGWSLRRPAATITLLDVYDAIGAESLFGLHQNEPNLECPVGRGIGPALSQTYRDVARSARRALARATVDDVLREALTGSAP
jgi:DNA-binding IscR family transcriptional regulator